MAKADFTFQRLNGEITECELIILVPGDMIPINPEYLFVCNNCGYIRLFHTGDRCMFSFERFDPIESTIINLADNRDPDVFVIRPFGGKSNYRYYAQSLKELAAKWTSRK